MDFSLTTLFVATSGDLATTGSTNNLTGGQLGVFNPDYTIAGSGTIATKPYIYIAQGRIEVIPGLGSKRSDKIAANKVVKWYKVPAVQNAATQITTVGSWNLECDQEITVTFVLHSNYIDQGFYNGLTRSVVVRTPCCECGANPCASVTGAALDSFIDEVAAKININVQNSPIIDGNQLSRFLVASRVGSSASGGSPLLVITEKPLDIYGNPCDFAAFPYEYDRMWFRTFVMNGPFTTQDLEVADACNIAGVPVITQRSAYQTGTSAEIAQLEKNLYSYQTSLFKSTYSQNAWNQAFVSYVTANSFYDTYYIEYYAQDDHETTWNPAVLQDSMVIVAFPAGDGGDFEDLLTVYLGAPVDWVATNPTTTTTTSTTSTSTSSTTTLMP
jgi:hypothetical protein